MEKAEEIADKWDLETIEYLSIPKADFDIIVNATPIGSLPDAGVSLMHADHLKPEMVVMDIVTNPLETQLIKEAKKAGATTITGERMLLHQAVEQFRIWHDQDAHVELM